VLPTIFVTVLGFALMMGLMALGVMLQGKRLKGSCGGNPDSVHCGCSPEKKAACRAKQADGEHEEEDDIFAGPPLTDETLAPPGEQRLIQLRTGRR
jgi:hypothetical protein